MPVDKNIFWLKLNRCRPFTFCTSQSLTNKLAKIASPMLPCCSDVAKTLPAVTADPRPPQSSSGVAGLIELKGYNRHLLRVPSNARPSHSDAPFIDVWVFFSVAGCSANHHITIPLQ